MPERIQVSSANPVRLSINFSLTQSIQDKVVYNGVDLVNQEELSSSQRRELQRYIEENAHLLQFSDKPREGIRSHFYLIIAILEEPAPKPKPRSKYADALSRLGQEGGKRFSQISLHSPSSDYGTGKRYLDENADQQTLEKKLAGTMAFGHDRTHPPQKQ